MHRFVYIEVWPLTKGQGQNIISYSNSLKVIEHDQKVKKASYWKKSFLSLFIPEFDLDLDLKMEEKKFKKLWGEFCLCSCKISNFKMLSPLNNF